VHHAAEGIQQRLGDWTVQRPFLVVGFAATMATLLALWIHLWFAVALAAILVGSCLVWRRPFWCLAALTAAVLLLHTAGYRYRTVEPLAALNGQQDTVTGQVVEMPNNTRMMTVEVSKADLVPAGTYMALFLPEEMAPQLWDTVTVQVTLSNAPRSSYLPGRGVHLYAFPIRYDDTCIEITSGIEPPTARWSHHLYTALRRVLPGEEGEVLAALCLGRDEGLSEEVQGAFRGSGLSHLLVVSGLHLSLVVLAVRLFLRRTSLGLRASSALTIPVMVLFMALVGTSPSVMRAGVMCLCWLIGGLCRRKAEGMNSLGLAVTVLLLLNPYQLYHAGFQLSFLATAGVLCLTPRLRGWLYRRPVAETLPGRLWQGTVNFVYSAVAVCFSAVLFTLPVSCYYFGGFSASTLLSNLLAVVPAGWVLLWGWVGILCLSVPFLSWLGQPILLVAGYGARYLTGIARVCSFEWAQVSVNTWWQWLLLTAVCFLLTYALMARLSLRQVLPPLIALVLVALPVGHLLATPSTTLTVRPGNAGVAVLLRQEERTGLLLTHSHDLDDVLWLLEEQRCDRLDFLVVAQGDSMDAGLLEEVYRQTEQPQVVTTDREDWWSGVTFSVQRLPYTKPITLWDGCTLTPTTKTWWRLDCGGDPVQVGGDAAVPCLDPEGLAVYAGVPRRVHTPAVVACTTADLMGKPLDWAGDVLLLTDDYVTFTIHPDGEWSVLPWL